MPLDDYQIISKIGTGSYSSVYKAAHKTDKRMVALKKVLFHRMDEKGRANSMREVRLLQSLLHPNIVDLLQVVYDEELETLWVALELAQEGDLSQKVEQCQRDNVKMPEEQLWKVLQQISAGLVYLHSQNVVHRDIKPNNILCYRDGTVKIADLNVSVTNPKDNNTRAGTLPYASPEVCSGHHFNSKSDIWSLGCLMYELITLRKPFRGEDPHTLFKQIFKSNRLRINCDVSQELKDLVLIMIQQNPKLRPSAKEIYKTCSAHLKKILQPVIRSSLSQSRNLFFKRHPLIRQVKNVSRKLIVNSEGHRKQRYQQSGQMTKVLRRKDDRVDKSCLILKNRTRTRSMYSEASQEPPQRAPLRKYNVHRRLIRLPPCQQRQI